MISVIVCSKSKWLRENLIKNIEATIGLSHEVVVIDNQNGKMGICEAYNIGASRAQYPILCFCHEDISFHTKNWGSKLIKHFSDRAVRLVGVLGCIIKTKAPSSVYISESHFNRQNHLQKYSGEKVLHCFENRENETVSEVCILDGLFIASTKDAWTETKFSEDYLKGFHGYDIDFSLNNFRLGKVIVIYDILLEHFSFGSFNSTWVESQMLVAQRWQKYLPAYSQVMSKEDKKNAEKRNLIQFLKILLNQRYNKGVIVKYFIKLLMIAPYNPMNLYFLRQILLGQKLDSRVKSYAKHLR